MTYPTQMQNAHVRKCDLAYLVQSDAPGAIVKIGRTQDAQQRVTQLKHSVPFAIRLIAVMTGGVKQEKAFKQRFQHLQHKGEWFRPVEEMNAYLREASEGALLVERHTVTDEFFKAYIEPAILQWLNGRTPKFNAAGDFLARVLQVGPQALDNRRDDLVKHCPGVTPELMRGYLPAPLGREIPRIDVPMPAEARSA